jgi:hypothetical protein
MMVFRWAKGVLNFKRSSFIVNLIWNVCLLGQAEEGTDEVYAQVSLTPESEVSFVQITCIVWASECWDFIILDLNNGSELQLRSAALFFVAS